MVPRLRPGQLHRVIAAIGLEACADLIAQATPAQLSQVFDLDLWRPPRPGLDEQFDPARFGLWIDVLADAGPEIAAAKLAEMPLSHIIAGLAHHVDVFDVAAVSTYETTDGLHIDYSRPVRARVGIEIGGYHVAARREDAWDAIVAVLVALDTHHPDRFVALMRAVRSRSHSRREPDGFHSLLENREQMMFDVCDERDRRRRERGFASPAEARAFLQMARHASPMASTAATDAITRDYFQSIETEPDGDAPVTPTPEEALAVSQLLAEAGVRPLPPPRALLESGRREPPRANAFDDRQAEVAYLANVLIAGCPVQGRVFTPREAADAVVAICNLGLDLEAGRPPTRDLITVFQIGWRTLYEEVCLCAANALADVLATLRAGDDETQASVNLLRVRLCREIAGGTPWRARDRLVDVLTTIDIPATTALAGLIAECPVIHAALPASLDRHVRAIEPDAFQFISQAGQLAMVRRFMTALPAILG